MTSNANFASIPIIDFSQSTNIATRAIFLRELRDALVRVGFFYLRNHPIPDEVQQDLICRSMSFFDLPQEKKVELEMIKNRHFFGYIQPTDEKGDHREAFALGMDLPPPGPDEPVYRNMHGPNPWPEEAAVPGFRQAVKTYLEYIRRVTDEFKVLVAEALDLKSTAFLDFFDEQCTSRFTLNKYSLPKSTGPVDKLQGHLAHTDGSFLTFLLQGTTHGGLEVQNKSGVWIPVPPLPGTLVVNLGRQMESVTGRICTATTHRVTLSRRNFTSPDGCTLGPRFSFALFQNLSLDLSRDAMSVEIPAHISRLVHGEQPKSDAKRWFCDSSKPGTAIGDELFAVRVLRHPEVGQKWYPDILAKARAHQAARN